MFRFPLDNIGKAVIVVLLTACGTSNPPEKEEVPEQDTCNYLEVEKLYATGVVDFTPGTGSGFGQDEMPDVVLGPPSSPGNGGGSLNVVSLGVGGSITLSFDVIIENGDGVDFIVFENPFVYGENEVWEEIGRVSVSETGETWHEFQCTVEDQSFCAGREPVMAYEPCDNIPLSRAVGGDQFDLDHLGLDFITQVRVTNVSEDGYEPSIGFDLDAVGVVNYE